MIKPVERKVMVPAVLPKVGGLSVLHEAVKRIAEAHNHHDDMVNSALRGGVSAENNGLIVFVEVTVQMPAEAPWIPFNLQNSWAAVGGIDTPGYLMEPGGKVWMRGEVSGGTSNTALALKIPGYGPTVKIAYAAGLDVLAEVRIFANGLITPIFASGAPRVSLSHSWIASPASAALAAPHPFPAPWPIIIQHGLKQCTGLEVLATSEISQNAKGPAPHGVPAWQDIGNGQLRLDGLWGLQWGKKYLVTMRLSAEA